MTTSYKRLSQSDRATIYRLRKLGKNQKEVAVAIGFSESTVSRELARNTGAKGYRPKQAGELTAARKVTQRPPKKIVGELADELERLLRIKYSPEQISGSLKKEHWDAPSIETIYQYVVRDKKAGGDLYTHLRINGTRRYRRRVKAPRSKIADRVGIEERPASVELRHYYGDWEADLVEGTKGTGFVLTLVDRKSRFTLFRKILNKTKQVVTETIIAALNLFKVRTITYDNGLEFAGHMEVNRELDARSFFCAPYHSWEKGLVENHNGLLRQYYKKGSSFEHITPSQLQAVEDEINERPRKTLEFSAPKDYLTKLTAA